MNDSVCLSSKDKWNKTTRSLYNLSSQLVPFEVTYIYVTTKSTRFIAAHSAMFQHRLLFMFGFDFVVQLGFQWVAKISNVNAFLSDSLISNLQL